VGTNGTIKPGLRVVVTAGASGIGRAIADTLIAHGARVHVCDVDEGVLARFRREQPGAGATLADVADEKQVDRLFDEAAAGLGGLDVLVNNAGIAGPTKPVEDMEPAEWRRTVDVNLTGQFYCLRRAVPLLKQVPDGAIVAISSVAGRLGYALRTPYAASKWAIIGFTKSLSKELGPHNIRVNAILPGLTRGRRIREVLESRARSEGIPYEEMRKRYVSRTSLRRMVEPQDIAGAALFLSSPAGANISGQAISVCAGVEDI
jgi:NAD(P)-dependent dehydrogenase (short-subunit alcohol dehydrogenase family)